MKKINLLIMVLFLSTAFMINANGQENSKEENTPEVLAKKSTDLLVTETNIDATIARKAYNYFLDYHKAKAKLTFIQGESQDSIDYKNAKLKECNVKLERNLKTILTEDQYKNAKSVVMEMSIVSKKTNVKK